MISSIYKEIIVLTTHRNKIWYLKHRPSKISEYIFQSDDHKQVINSYITAGIFPHLLFAGGPGSGKTTLVNILLKELQINPLDILYINASEENSIETIRDKVKNFVSSLPFGEFKVVHLEEAERISLQGQDALKAIMEDCTDTARFVLTTNAEHKITPAIRSRCTRFYFSGMNVDDLTMYLAKVLIDEDVSCDLDILDGYVNALYPDVRRIVNSLQQNSTTGTLLPVVVDDTSNVTYQNILNHINNNDWDSARSMVCSFFSVDEWDIFYRFLYDNIKKCNKFNNQDNWESAIVILAEHLYKDALVADREINAVAMMIKLSQI